MIRITTLLWIALLVVAGGTVMRVSYQVRHLEKHLAQIARETRQEQEVIRILGAEWDTLNDPHRIDALAKRYLSLESTPIQRVVSLEAIPFKPSDGQLARLAAAAVKGPTGDLNTKKSVGTVKATAASPVPAPVRPAGAPDVTTAASVRQTPMDGVGLILAHLDQH
jgi:cell division protein FtsL